MKDNPAVLFLRSEILALKQENEVLKKQQQAAAAGGVNISTSLGAFYSYLDG